MIELMNHAEPNLTFMCPKLYVSRLIAVFEAGGMYWPSSLQDKSLHADHLHEHASFCRHYDILVDLTHQATPQYVHMFRYL